jgi:acetylornithine deacetylase/succinyl-diaminopimelate desuccinylase-like protein
VPYCTEACIWVPELGIPAVICGPGSPGMAHQPDEFTPIAELELAASVYERVARELLC